jgi:lantibiotic leader peptide-processing serine protease
MRTPDRSWFSFALSLCLATSLAACGADLAPPDTTTSASAATASKTYLVSFASGTVPSNAASIVGAGNTILATYSNVGVVLVQSSDTGFASKLRADSRIDAVGDPKAVSSSISVAQAPTLPAQPPGGPRAKGADPLAYRQWDMDQIQASLGRAKAGTKPVLVGVLDSGVDPTHPDLVGQVNAAASASCIGGVPNTDPTVWSNDIIGHGTHVSGNIAGLQNGVGIVGVAPNAKIAAVKLAVDDVNDPNFGLVFADAMVCAIDWAVGHGVDVMNASLTIDPYMGPIDDIFCTDEPGRADVITVVRKAVAAAAAQDVPLVASTGNMFLDISSLSDAAGPCYVLPVGVPTVIGVSAVGYTGKLSWFSDYGKGEVDIAGPGGDNLVPDPFVTDTTASGQVLSSVPPNSLYYAQAAQWNGQVQDCTSGTCATYAYLQGTSQAAPHVTGVAALLISRHGRLSPSALQARLQASAHPLPCPKSPYDPGMTGQPATCTGPASNNNFYGPGEVNANVACSMP